jgi:hypothetical protein
MNRSRLGLARLGLYWPDFWLNRAGLRLAGTGLGLARSYVRLARPGWLNLRPVIWLARPYLRLTRTVDLARPGTGLAGANFGLVGTVWHCSGSGPRKPRLRCDGAGSCDHGRTALVYVIELFTILLRFTLMLELSGHGRDSGTAHGFNFGRPRPVGDAASAAVVGDAIVVIDDDGAVVDVGDVDVDAVYGAVVVEVVAAPIATVIANAGVAEAVVDATVEANVRAPEAAMKAVAVVIPAPIAGGPEGAVVGWSAPGAWDPVVAGGSPVPVAGSPDVVRCRGDGLFINRKRRGRLVGVFDGLGLAFFVELIVCLSVLIGLILIGGWWRNDLLRSRFL